MVEPGMVVVAAEELDIMVKMEIKIRLLHFFFKSKEIIVLFWDVACGFTYLVWVFVFRIKKFYNLKATTIYIKMDISLIIIWSMRLPNSCFRM